MKQSGRPPLLVLSLLWPKLTSLTSAHYFHIYIPFSTPLQKAKVLTAFLQNFIELTKDDVTYLNNLTQTCSICQWTNSNSNIRPPPLSPPTKFSDIFPHKTGR